MQTWGDPIIYVLVGKSVVQIKQEAKSQPNHANLTVTTKVKNGKKSQFTLTGRSRTKSATKGDIDFEDLVCPFSDSSDVQNLSSDDSTAK